MYFFPHTPNPNPDTIFVFQDRQREAGWGGGRGKNLIDPPLSPTQESPSSQNQTDESGYTEFPAGHVCPCLARGNPCLVFSPLWVALATLENSRGGGEKIVPAGEAVKISWRKTGSSSVPFLPPPPRNKDQQKTPLQ